MDAPRTLALRRIHIVNHGAGTVLRDWEVWVSAPDLADPTAVRVLSSSEWASIGTGVGHGDVPILCRGDVLYAAKDRRIRRDIPFVVEGMLPDEVTAGNVSVRVLFRDRANRHWLYGQETAAAITGDRFGRSVAASSAVA